MFLPPRVSVVSDTWFWRSGSHFAAASGRLAGFSGRSASGEPINSLATSWPAVVGVAMINQQNKRLVSFITVGGEMDLEEPRF